MERVRNFFVDTPRRRRLPMTARRLTLVALALTLVVPASSLGSKAKPRTVAPTSAQRAAILKAFGDAGARAACLSVGLAASNRNYATVRFLPAKGCIRWAFNGKNILRRGDRDHWSIVFEASAYRCPLARIPAQVQRQLGVCP
jgi:hypothetical protein